MRNRSVRALAVVSVFAALLGATGLGGARVATAAERDRAVTVASFDFAESRLLAEIYAQALERTGVPVHRAFGLGPREVVAPALAGGLVDLVPEYAGTAVQFLSLGHAPAEPDIGRTRAALEHALAGTRVRSLASAPAQDANVFVVRREVADRYGLTRMSDLRRVANRLSFGGPPECATRPLCLPGLRRVYGVDFNEIVPLDAGGPLTHQAVDNGIVDVALLFSTDPSLDSRALVELTDDRALQPAENVTPLVRTQIIERFGPRLVAALDAVSARLDTAALRTLNARVQGPGNIRSIATRWLDAEHLQ